jgi:hypothetical protein
MAPTARPVSDWMAVICAWQPLLGADLAAGRVVPASERVVEIETGYWLTSAAGDEPRREIRAPKHWILSEAGRGTSASHGFSRLVRHGRGGYAVAAA